MKKFLAFLLVFGLVLGVAGVAYGGYAGSGPGTTLDKIALTSEFDGSVGFHFKLFNAADSTSSTYSYQIMLTPLLKLDGCPSSGKLAPGKSTRVAVKVDAEGISNAGDTYAGQITIVCIRVSPGLPVPIKIIIPVSWTDSTPTK